jgi:hypothetical protein
MELQGAGDAIRRVEEGISRLGRSLEPAAESIESARERLGSSRAWMDDVPLSTIALVAVWALAVMFLLLGLALVAVAGALRSVERRPAARPVAPMGARAGAA